MISSKKLSDTLGLSECTDGFWLYDYTREMNLSMRADTEVAALVEALHYYQRRLTNVEKGFKDLREKVDGFVSHFIQEEE